MKTSTNNSVYYPTNEDVVLFFQQFQAQKRRVSYNELAQFLGYPSYFKARSVVRYVLDNLFQYCVEENLPLYPAMLEKKDGSIGERFFKLAEQCGFVDSNDDYSRVRFVLECWLNLYKDLCPKSAFDGTKTGYDW